MKKQYGVRTTLETYDVVKDDSRQDWEYIPAVKEFPLTEEGRKKAEELARTLNLAGQGCRCYVKHLDRETRFYLHWGSHAENCPAYRPSLDPVDRRHDEEARRRLQAYVLGGDIRPVRSWPN